MECHDCEHRAEVEAGKFRDVAFEQTPCARCAAEVGPTFSQEYVEGYGGAEPLDDSPAVPELAFPEECPADPVYPASVFVTAIAAFFSLSDIDLCVLRLKYQRLSHDQVAERMGITPRAVEGRFSRILARYPVLVTLFPCRRVGG